VTEQPSRGSQVEHWLSLGASVVAPVTLLSALLFYFGYASSRAQYEYFGIDVDTIGLSTRDYVMRSPQPLLTPLLVLILLGAGLTAGHLWVRARLAQRQDGVRRPLQRVMLAGLAILLVGVVLLGAYAALSDWTYYNLVTPLVIALGAGGVAYVWHLLTVTAQSRPAGQGPPTLRRMGMVMLCLLVASTIFWSTATIAQWAGLGLAHNTARHLDRLPTVILDTKERLFLHDPGVEETALPAGAGQTFHFRYRHLHLLIHGNDRMFLVPAVWSAGDSTLVVPLDGAVRVQFQFQNGPP
jgi:hypothetical protein